MADSINKQARLKDLKALAERTKAITDGLADRVNDLEKVSQALWELANSVIANIERKE